MVTVFAELVMFVSSFAPLLLVFALLDSFGSRTVQAVLIIVAGLSLAGLAVLFLLLNRLDNQTIDVTRARPRDGDAIAYVATYVLPFLTLGTDSWQSRVALTLFVLIVGTLVIRSHIFYVNPVLALFGFRLFEIEAGDQFVLVLTRRPYVRPGSTLSARRLSDYVYWEAGRR
jgi:hypothetical protein